MEDDIRSRNGFEDLRAYGIEPSGEVAVREDDHFHLVQHVDYGVGRQSDAVSAADY